MVEFPYITIGLVIRNEEQDIKDCLESIFNLDYPKEKITVIVCDSMSEDKTIDIVKRFPVVYLFR